MSIEKIKFYQHRMDIARYGKPNNLKFDSLKFKIRFCKKPTNILCDIILSIHMLSHIFVSPGYKMKCN